MGFTVDHARKALFINRSWAHKNTYILTHKHIHTHSHTHTHSLRENVDEAISWRLSTEHSEVLAPSTGHKGYGPQYKPHNTTRKPHTGTQHTHTLACIHAHIHVHRCTQTYIHTCTCIHEHMYVRTYIHTYTDINTHTCTVTHIYTIGSEMERFAHYGVQQT
jgi:hypothetical protein